MCVQARQKKKMMFGEQHLVRFGSMTKPAGTDILGEGEGEDPQNAVDPQQVPLTCTRMLRLLFHLFFIMLISADGHQWNLLLFAYHPIVWNCTSTHTPLVYRHCFPGQSCPQCLNLLMWPLLKGLPEIHLT